MAHNFQRSLLQRGHPDHDACGTGFIVRIGSEASHEVVDRGLLARQRLSHRGGIDADGASGGGAGLMAEIPQGFIRRVAGELGISLPRNFALGLLFLPRDHQDWVRRAVETMARGMGLKCLGWRDVPVNPNVLGALAQKTLPSIQPCFFSAASNAENFDTQLFLFRKRMEAGLGADAYCCSLSSRTVVYKGLLAPWQLAEFYPDLRAADFESRFAIFHQRFSTNTRPSCSLAQPFRLPAHHC